MNDGNNNAYLNSQITYCERTVGRLPWWIRRPSGDGDEVLLEDVEVPAQLGQNGRDGFGGQVAGQDEEGALVVPLAVNVLLLRELALLSQALQFPVVRGGEHGEQEPSDSEYL